MKIQTSNSATEQFLCEWVHDVSCMHAQYYSTDQQVGVTLQDLLQCAGKGSEEEDVKLVNMDLNKAVFNILPFLFMVLP